MDKVFDLSGKRIWIPGFRGMVGGALVRALRARGHDNLLLTGREELDLLDQPSVLRWARDHRPDAAFVPAARVGGIEANRSFPADFLYENLMIAANVIHAAHEAGVGRLLYLGSSCIYPRLASQPITEDQLLTGPLEPTNEAYAVAKIAGIKLCQAYQRQYGDDFIAAMPTNLYGPGDNFDLESSHVIPALLRKAQEAKERDEKGLEIWGTGTPRREFMHVDDCADALIHLMEHHRGEDIVNVGTGEDVTIAEVARLVMEVVGLEGELRLRPDRPDGTPRKLLSVERLRALGWEAKVPLRRGLEETLAWYLEHRAATRG